MNKRIANENLYKLAHSFNHLVKSAQSLSPAISTIIENASGQKLGIPNYKPILQNYNKTIDSKIAKVRISLQKNFWKTTSVISLYFIPSDGTAAVANNTTLNTLSSEMIAGINQYFAKYPETITNIPSGIYVAELPIL